ATVVAASANWPAAGDAQAVSAAVLRVGARTPPTAPGELINAMPPAAPAPVSSLVGNVQKIGGAPMAPAVATHNAPGARVGALLEAAAMPTPARKSAPAAMARREPSRPTSRGTTYAATAAHSHGIALTTP